MLYYLSRLAFVICCERFVIKLYDGIIKTSTKNDQQVSNISLKRLNDCPKCRTPTFLYQKVSSICYGVKSINTTELQE